MASVRRFEDLVAWRKCVGLSDAIFEATAQIDDETLRDHLRDAARSAPALIAEGFNRFTTPEFVRYLRMARGELGEIQSDLKVARGRRLLAPDPFESLSTLARRAMGTTTNLLKSKLRQLEAKKKRKRSKGK
jgi:four helix bundle protein